MPVLARPATRTRVELPARRGLLAGEADVLVAGGGPAGLGAALGAAQAGAPYEVGRTDGLVQPMTLMFRMVEFQHAAFAAYVDTHPDQWRGVHGLWDLVRQATAAGELELPREDILFFVAPHAQEVSVNSTRVTRVLGTDVSDLSYAESAGRRQMRQVAAFLRRYVPGFERA